MTWVSTLQKHISENLVSDEEFKTVNQRFPNNPPQSKEEYYYRSIFIKSYLPMHRYSYVFLTKLGCLTEKEAKSQKGVLSS